MSKAINLSEQELRAILWLVIDSKEITRKEFRSALLNQDPINTLALMGKKAMLENLIDTLNEAI